MGGVYIDSYDKAVGERTGADPNCTLDTSNPRRYHQEAFVANGIVNGSIPSNIPGDYTYFLHSHCASEDQRIEADLDELGYDFVSFPGMAYWGDDVMLYVHGGDFYGDPGVSCASARRPSRQQPQHTYY